MNVTLDKAPCSTPVEPAYQARTVHAVRLCENDLNALALAFKKGSVTYGRRTAEEIGIRRERMASNLV